MQIKIIAKSIGHLHDMVKGKTIDSVVAGEDIPAGDLRILFKDGTILNLSVVGDDMSYLNAEVEL